MRFAASPLARKLAQANQLDLAQVKGTGPDGRIIQRDVLSAMKGKGGSAQKQSREDKIIDPRLFYQKDSYQEITLSPMQRSVAKRMTQAMQTIPHYYVSKKYQMAELLAMRQSALALVEQRGDKFRPTLNDFLVRAAALALMEVPAINVSFAEECLLQHKHADIGVALALADGGLITPIVRKAEKKSVLEITRDMRELGQLAASRKLKPSQYEGGSFSVSNLGMYGVSHFTAIINPPQSAALALGAVENGVMEATLSSDHRAINGAQAAQFLAALGEIIENPHWLWLGL